MLIDEGELFKRGSPIAQKNLWKAKARGESFRREKELAKKVKQFSKHAGVQLPDNFASYLGFGAWMTHQWLPFITTITGGQWLDHMHYVLRYEVRATSAHPTSHRQTNTHCTRCDEFERPAAH